MSSTKDEQIPEILRHISDDVFAIRAMLTRRFKLSDKEIQEIEAKRGEEGWGMNSIEIAVWVLTIVGFALTLLYWKFGGGMRR